MIDLKKLEAVRRIDLGGSREITQAAAGRAAVPQRQHHLSQTALVPLLPSGRPRGRLTYDIEADGIGMSPVDNRTLRGILDTAPFKWEGTNPNLTRQCGARLSVFFTRLLPFTPDELSALDLLHHHHRAPAQSLPRARRAAQPGAAPRQGDLRAHHDQRRPPDPRGVAAASPATSRPISPTARRTTSARNRPATGRASSTCRT